VVNGLIGRKVGMTQLFMEDGRFVPVTLIQAGPCVVVQRKTSERDGYESAQLGLVETKPFRKANRPTKGHFERAGVPPTRELREFRLVAGSDPKPGDTVTCELFAPGQLVEVIGTSKGKGFQGAMKRHNFRGGANSHGSMFHRAPGSIGASAFPSRVFKGMRGPGHMGSDRVTVKNLKVVRVDAEKNLLLVRGAVPGAVGASVLVRMSPGAAPAAK
jgi:large subunit ribosomal protein L3